jgi:hypothetical protein
MRSRSSGVVYRLCKPVPLNSFCRLVSNPHSLTSNIVPSINHAIIFFPQSAGRSVRFCHHDIRF